MLNKCHLSLLPVLLLPDLLSREQACCDSGTFLSLTLKPPPHPWPPWAQAPRLWLLRAGREGRGYRPWSQSPCGAPPSRPQAPPGSPELPFRACQSNLTLGSSSVAKRKQISKHTSACPRFPPPPPRGLCSRLPWGSVAPGLSQAELKS